MFTIYKDISRCQSIGNEMSDNGTHVGTHAGYEYDTASSLGYHVVQCGLPCLCKEGSMNVDVIQPFYTIEWVAGDK